MHRLAPALLGSLALASISCSHAAPAETAAAVDAATAEPPLVGPPEVAWKDMSKEQRGRYMKARVMPRMKELLIAFAAEHGQEEINCATCHGEGARDKSFKMPNPDLEVLPGTKEGWDELMQAKPEWVKFMGEKVKPEIAALLGMEPFDPQNPKEGAFGCGACHTMEGGP